MPTDTVEVLIEGGKATAAPPVGPQLGPLGVNIGQIIADINKKTQDFKGMQVPVKIEVDTTTKAYTITVGTPPASSLLKQEASIKKGAGNALTERVANISIDQVIKVARMKEDNLLGKTLKMRVREILGTCQSMGIGVEGGSAQEALQAVQSGDFDAKLNA